MNTPSKESSYGTLEREPGSGHELNETPGKKIFNSFETKDVKTKDGIIKCYTIPAETILYHGSNTITLENGKVMIEKNKHMFFALSEEYAAKYAKKKGNIFCFKTNKKMDLVAIDKQNDTLFANAVNQIVDGYDIQTIMRDNYGFHNNHKRKSEPEKDNALSQYLCENGYNGYAAGKMDGVNLTYDLDPEIVLCDTSNLTFERLKKVTVENIPDAITKGKNAEIEIEEINKPKPTRLDFSNNGGTTRQKLDSGRKKKQSKNKQTKKRHVKKQSKKKRAKK